MGNYKHFESDFVKRTLHLIGQYESVLHKYEFDHQYNHTLLANCLLGLIVMPKEKAISFLPADRLTNELKQKMGIVQSSFNPDIKNLKDLIKALRNSIGHSDLDFVSNDENFLIDEIQFWDRYEGKNDLLASFVPSELLSFVRYYGGWFIHNLEKYNPSQLDN